MRKDYTLDIDKKSKWVIYSAGAIENYLPFRLEECGMFCAKGDFFTEGEDIPNYLLMYTVSGAGYCHYNDKKQLLEPNTAILINCKNQFYVKTLEKEWNYYWFHFSGIAMEQYYGYISDKLVQIQLEADNREITNDFEELLGLQEVLDLQQSYLVSNILSNILTCLIRNKDLGEEKRAEDAGRNVIKSIKTYIEDHYSEEVSLEVLAEKVHLSKHYMIKRFKSVTGETPYNYLLNYRISQAKIMLRISDYSISEIAEKIGFASLNNFIIQFKRKENITPRAYREKQSAQIKDLL